MKSPHALAALALVTGITATAQAAEPIFESLATLHVVPAQLASFTVTLRDNAAHARTEPGNQVFDVHQDQEHPEQLVQVERWTDESQHQENLKRPVIQQIRAGYKDTLAKPMMSGRVPVNDITEG